MSPLAKDGYWPRLEVAGELLEAGLVRYRLLQRALKRGRATDALKGHADLLREAGDAEKELGQALARAQDRARSEQWLAGPTVRLLAQVESARGKLLALARKRAQVSSGSLEELLHVLEARVLREAEAGGVFGPGQRRAVARDLLPSNLPAVHRCARLGAELEALTLVAAARAATNDELVVLSQTLREAQEPLRLVGERLHRLDHTGTLMPFLEQRSRRQITGAAQDGPDQVIRLMHWRDVATASLREQLQQFFEPLRMREDEFPDLCAWLAERAQTPRAGLPASHAIPEARAGLLQLAFGLRPDAPQTPADELLEQARRADGQPPPADIERMRESLTLLVRVAGGEEAPWLRAAPSLEALVLRIRGLRTRQWRR